MIALEDLKIKAYEHAIKAIKQPKYTAAANTAFTLYQELQLKATRYISAPQNYSNFRQECELEIQKAKTVLETHRGYKQILLDILNVVFAVVGWLNNRDWRFFKANTASMIIVEDIRKNLSPNS